MYCTGVLVHRCQGCWFPSASRQEYPISPQNVVLYELEASLHPCLCQICTHTSTHTHICCVRGGGVANTIPRIHRPNVELVDTQLQCMHVLSSQVRLSRGCVCGGGGERTEQETRKRTQDMQSQTTRRRKVRVRKKGGEWGDDERKRAETCRWMVRRKGGGEREPMKGTATKRRRE